MDEKELYESIPYERMDEEDGEMHLREAERRRLIERDIRVLERVGAFIISLALATLCVGLYFKFPSTHSTFSLHESDISIVTRLPTDVHSTFGGIKGISDLSVASDIQKLYDKELTSSPFEEFKNFNHSDRFVMFYAPWCVWCQRLLPTWEEFAIEVGKLHFPLDIGRVDCVAQSQFCKDNNIMAFPTLRYYRAGVLISDYREERTVSSLLHFSREKLGLPTPNNHDEAIESEIDRFKVDEELPSGDEEQLEPEHEESPLEDDKEEIVIAVEPERIPAHLNQNTFDSFLKAHNDAFVDFYMPYCDGCHGLAPMWEKFAQQARNRNSLVAVAKVDCSSQAKICEEQKVTTFPTLRWYDSWEKTHVDYSGEHNVGAFLDYASNKLALLPFNHHRQESIHTTREIESLSSTISEEEGVELDISNFHDVLSHNDLVFVNFYAPWCIWSQRLKPIWEALGRFGSQSQMSVTIATVDCVQNAFLCQQQNINAFPSLMLYRKEGDPVSYCHGARTVDALSSFLKLQMSVRSDIENLRWLDTNDFDDAAVSPASYSLDVGEDDSILSVDVEESEEKPAPVSSHNTVEDDVIWSTDALEDEEEVSTRSDTENYSG